MNTLFTLPRRLLPTIGAALLLCGVVLAVSAIRAESKKSAASEDQQWPSVADRPNVKKGFTRALNRSARDQQYRDALLDFTKQDTVRDKVQDALRQVPGCENMTIPNEITLIFYVPQKGASLHVGNAMPKEMKAQLEKWENRNLHVFYLPDFNPNDTADHPYDVHIMCCYKPW
jgi:hypothetical protein